MHCKRSKTGGVEGLGTRLSRAMLNFTVLLPCARFMTFGMSYAGDRKLKSPELAILPSLGSQQSPGFALD